MRDQVAPAGMVQMARTNLVRLLRREPGASRIVIADRLGLSRSSVSRIVSALLAQGLVTEGEELISTSAGRRSKALYLNAKSFELLGVQVSGTTVTCALTNLNGDIAHELSAKLSPSGGQDSVKALLTLISTVVLKAEASGSKIKGVGVGAPGVIDSETGRVVWAPALGWRDLPLREIVRDKLGLPTFVENDVRLATVGEHWIGSGVGADTMVYLFIREGIGAGIIINDELIRGHRNFAGEVGYQLPHRGFLEHSHRDIGAMESVATSAGIASRLSKLDDAGLCGIGPLGPGTQISHEQLLRRATVETSRALEELSAEFIDYVAIIIVNIATVVDPKLIVLGGVFASTEPWVLPAIVKRIESSLPSPPSLKSSKLGAKAGVIGAAVHVLLEVEGLYARRWGVVDA